MAVELVKALTASVVAGAQEQAVPAGLALTYQHGILGVYEVFLAVVRDAPHARGTAVFDQTPLLTAAILLQSLANATDGERVQL